MSLDRISTYGQHLGDRFVVETLGNESQNAQLLIGEGMSSRGTILGSWTRSEIEFLNGFLKDISIDYGIARSNHPNGMRDTLWIHFLRKESSGSQRDCASQILDPNKSRQYDYRSPKATRFDGRQSF